MLKEKFFKFDSDNFNRAFIESEIAAKFNLILEHKTAFDLSCDAFDRLPLCCSVNLSLSDGNLPDEEFSTYSLCYLSLCQMYKSALTDKEKLRTSKLCLINKPLIKKNLDNVLKHTVSDSFEKRAYNLNVLFDKEKFNTFSAAEKFDFSTSFSDLNVKLYAPEITKNYLYSDLKSWLLKVLPDKSISSVKDYAKEVDSENFAALYELTQKLKTFFDMPSVKVYVIYNRNQGIISNFDGEEMYIIIDGEMLDTELVSYPEMVFSLSKEFAALKLDFAKLMCRGQFRYFDVLGRPAVDIISQYVPQPQFLQNEVKSYTKIMKFNQLLINYPDYFQFDVSDTERAAQMSEETLKVFDFKGESKLVKAKEQEFASLSLLTAFITDRIGLLLSQNIVCAVKAMINNDKQIKGGADFLKKNTVYDLAVLKNDSGKPLNYDFAMRLNNLVSFYLSEDYEKLQKVLQKN